jgi:predicted RNA-binding Zn ribbon-like protein
MKAAQSIKARADKFKLIGGAASLDFANTVGGRNEARVTERNSLEQVSADKLEEYADLLAWSRKSNLLTEQEIRALQRKAQDHPKAAAAVLKRAIHLREVIYRLFKAAIEGRQPVVADVVALNEEWQLARTHQRLVYEKDEFRFDWESGEIGLDKMLWLLAQSAASVLTSERLLRVKQCEGEACGWIFLDTSHSGNRSWCDMRDCGNRAKIRRYRQKVKEKPPRRQGTKRTNNSRSD